MRQKKTIASYILHALAEQRRVVAADWRIHVAYVRVAREHAFKLPGPKEVKSLIGKLERSEDIAPVAGISGVYRVTSPYAATLAAPDEVVIQEANPFAVFSCLTAAAYHELTDVLPKKIYATNHRDSRVRDPLGTTPDDWTDVPRPRRRTPAQVDGVDVVWPGTKPEWDFGHIIGYAQGCPIYVTDLERTLLDGLRFPEKSGGMREVVQAWNRARDRLDLERMVAHVERFGLGFLRQRVGFLLERLGFTHPAFDTWAQHSVRGSSAKLVAHLAFSSHHSDRWNLSLNLPDSVLSELRAS